MMLLLVIFGGCLSMGLFLIFSDVLKLPGYAVQRAMLQANKQAGEKSGFAEAFFSKWAAKLAGRIHMDEYKKSRMAKTLKAAGIHVTPEMYTAGAIVKAAAVMLGILPCLLILPIAAPLLLFLSAMVYFKEIRKADIRLNEKREKIESELPRFAATITQELSNSRDVLAMVEHYKKNSKGDFAAELDILTADMRSSSYEAALSRFEARINSVMLCDIVRGLIGVLRGDEASVYFQMLAHDMKQLELQRLRAKAMKIPGKIRVFSFIMLMCFLLTYLCIITYEIVNSLGGMF